MTDTRAALAALIESPHFDTAFEKALAAPACPEWLTEAYLSALATEYDVLPKTYESSIR